MTDITYDPEADAVYITVGRGNIDRTQESGPFIYDVDAEGHIVGIEILSASKVLALGDWKKPGSLERPRIDAGYPGVSSAIRRRSSRRASIGGNPA
jgi:uncharacterized protein YuzE